MEAVRSIVYFWWRKSEQDSTGIIKFGDHTEPMNNIKWYEDTEKYIQQTAAPREKNTFKNLIGYCILDVTEYAKTVNRNYKFAKVDNYIIDKLDFNKYRIGKTDQFKLSKFEYTFDEFIDLVKEFTSIKPVLDLKISIEELNILLTSKSYTFDFSKTNKALTVLSIIPYLKNSVLIITDNIEKYEEQIKQYKNLEKYKLYYGISNDLMFNYLDSITLVKDIEDLTLTNQFSAIIRDKDNVDIMILK